jgi:hypothetical protein
MISSTARDLVEHREAVKDACLRQSFFPVMMEHLPASDADAIAESLRMVDESAIYLGILAHRYGYIPKGYNISITEIEYNHAGVLGIPRLMFVMDKKYAIQAEDVEMGESAGKLEAFKARVETERVVRFFRSSDGLRCDVIDALSRLRGSQSSPFHHVTDIPAPPEPYVAHPYTLLQAGRLIGRHAELNELTQWATRSDQPICCLVAIGGIGKSALAWHWFHKVAQSEMKLSAGSMWWSFYESDATFENFIVRALAYVTKRPRGEVQRISPPERERQLFGILNRESYLLVLDGLERILTAYARLDASRLSDEEMRRMDVRQRSAIDPHVGAFVRKLSACRASRLLITTRLYPAELEDKLTGDPLPTCMRRHLLGLSDDDALDLWRAFGIGGAGDVLLPVFRSFGMHALWIQALAGVIKRDRQRSGDVEQWLHLHPRFNPMALTSVKEACAHVLEFALRGLGEFERNILHTLAAFRMPVGYDTLVALLNGDERHLDVGLSDLEDRGLLGWDRRANRYDLHPIVRGVIWQGLDRTSQQRVYEVKRIHLEQKQGTSQDDGLDALTPAIELYSTLIGLERYDDAYDLFRDRLDGPMLYRLSACCLAAELLEALFPDGLDQLPRLTNHSNRGDVLNSLARSYRFTGIPGKATSFHKRACDISDELGELWNLASLLCQLADALRLVGEFRKSYAAVKSARDIMRSRVSSTLPSLAMTLATCGEVAEAGDVIEHALEVYGTSRDSHAECRVNACAAQRALWVGDAASSRLAANRAWALSTSESRYGRDVVRAARLQGEAALALDDLTAAEERLLYAMTCARRVDVVEEELAAVTAMAELKRRQSAPKAARELLETVWLPAERGPYPLFQADALNVLAQIEQDVGDGSAAVQAATKAFKTAWCEGPPLAYHWGLEKAKTHLAALGADVPVKT